MNSNVSRCHPTIVPNPLHKPITLPRGRNSFWRCLGTGVEPPISQPKICPDNLITLPIRTPAPPPVTMPIREKPQVILIQPTPKK